MNWNLLVTKNARRELGQLPDRDQRRLLAALDENGGRSIPWRYQASASGWMAEARWQLSDFLRSANRGASGCGDVSQAAYDDHLLESCKVALDPCCAAGEH